MLIKGYAVMGAVQESGKHQLASFDRLTPQVLAVEFDEVKGA